MIKDTNYASPEIQVIMIKGGQVLCSSNLINSPGKGNGFEWNDDLY